MPLKRRLTFLGVGLIIAIALGIGLFTQVGTKAKTGPPRAGDPVPTFSLPTLTGTGHVGVPADGGGNGTPAILLFFASWCGPCRTEIPDLSTVYNHQHAAHSPLTAVRVLGIDGNDPKVAATAFAKTSAISFPVGMDTNFDVVSGKFFFTGLPEAVFVKGDGTIAGIHYGALSTKAFVAWQHQLLSA